MNTAVYDSLMTQAVTLIKRSQDYTGSLTDDTTDVLSGFVQYGTKRVVTREGETIDATAIVFLKNDAPIDPSHEWYDVIHNGRRMKVETIDPIVDPRYNFRTHYELTVI
jgi:hypothetical protein